MSYITRPLITMQSFMLLKKLSFFSFWFISLEFTSKELKNRYLTQPMMKLNDKVINKVILKVSNLQDSIEIPGQPFPIQLVLPVMGNSVTCPKIPWGIRNTTGLFLVLF